MAGKKYIGIAIDGWKRETFQSFLTESGFEYAVYPLGPKDTFLIKVFTSDRVRLQPIVEKANRKCAEMKN